MSATDTLANLQQKQDREQATIAARIRKAVRDALPTPNEQFFTLMVPGTVLDLTEYTTGRDKITGDLLSIALPTSVQLAEAKLCDDMPALSGIQLGPTGRSVARSYGATLSKLVPSGTTIGINDDTLAHNPNLDSEQQRYKKAMEWLKKKDPENQNKTPVDVYTEKLAAYTTQINLRTDAYQKAMDLANNNPKNTNNLAARMEEYDKWVQKNARTWRNAVQGAYMDLVTNGKKEQVEYWFAVVDNDSAQSRVEASKEAMRDLTVTDEQGAVEYQIVDLTPKNWAWLAQKKISADRSEADRSRIMWQINRLEKMNILLDEMSKTPAPIPAPPDPAAADESKVRGLAGVFLKAQKDASEAPSHDNSQALQDARKKLADEFEAYDKAKVAQLSTAAIDAQKQLMQDPTTHLSSLKAENLKQYNSLNEELKNLSNYSADQAAAVFVDQTTVAAGIPPDSTTSAGGPTAAGAAGAAADGGAGKTAPIPDYWTKISVEVSSSSLTTEATAEANSYSGGASAGWGLWSVGGGVSHSDSTAKARSQMAACDVSVQFDCLRVNIDRAWLRSELFYDSDLTVADGENGISPGPLQLVQLMSRDDGAPAMVPALTEKEVQTKLQQFSLFPMYPTAFLLAANVVLDLQGQTSDIQTYFHTATTSGSVSVGWGPFSVSASYSHTETQQRSSCEATATGCRITINAPQIIGWISEMVPALPRLKA